MWCTRAKSLEYMLTPIGATEITFENKFLLQLDSRVPKLSLYRIEPAPVIQNRSELENNETRCGGQTDASLDSCAEPKEPLVVEGAI